MNLNLNTANVEKKEKNCCYTLSHHISDWAAEPSWYGSFAYCKLQSVKAEEKQNFSTYP